MAEGVRTSLDGGDEADVSTCLTTTMQQSWPPLGQPSDLLPAGIIIDACSGQLRRINRRNEATHLGFRDDMSACMFDVAVRKPGVTTGIYGFIGVSCSRLEYQLRG